MSQDLRGGQIWPSLMASPYRFFRLSDVVPAGGAGVLKGSADDALQGFVHRQRQKNSSAGIANTLTGSLTAATTVTSSYAGALALVVAAARIATRADRLG